MVRINPRAHVEAARLCGADPIMDDTAKDVLKVVRRVASRHRDTGQYMHNLSVVVAEGYRGKDRLVQATDPAAIPIEFGHWQITRRRGGRRVSARWVPGLHIMRDAYKEVKRVT
jgi:hypothetical protein